MDATTPDLQALLTPIPEADQRGFDRYYAQQLQTALQRGNSSTAVFGIDEEAIERQLIDDLIRQAEGRDTATGRGAVPSGAFVHRIEVPERDPRTDATSARHGTSPAGTTANDMTPLHWAGITGILLLLLGYVAWSVMGSAASDASADTSPPPLAPSLPLSTMAPVVPTTLGELGEASDMTVADPSSLEIRRPDGSSIVLRVLPSPGVLGGPWTPSVGADQVAWLQGTQINRVFCLPAQRSDLLSALKRGRPILLRPASGALQHYEVLRTRSVGRQQVEVLDQRRAGLTLLPCTGDGSTRTVVEAVYRPQAVERPIQALGTNAALADLARVQVQQVQVLTPTADLPPGLSVVQLRVEVANLNTAPLLWTDLADQLEIAGRVAETVPSVAQPPLGPGEIRTVRLRYRVPSAGGDALWRMTAATSDSVTVRVTIPPAPVVSRTQATLRAEDVRLVGTGQAARLAITLTITARGTDPVTLDAAAVGVWDGATALPLHAESTPLPLLLPPGEPRPLTLVVDRPDAAALTVQSGQQRWRVTIP